MAQFGIVDILGVVADKVADRDFLGHAVLFLLENTNLGEDLFDAILDSQKASFSGREAYALGAAFSDTIGNIAIKVNGRDVVRTQAQREFFGALARVARQVLIAKGMINIEPEEGVPSV